MKPIVIYYYLDSFGGRFKHQQLVQKGVDVTPYMEEVNKNNKLWSEIRAQDLANQRETLSITLRKQINQSDQAGKKQHINNIQKSIATEHYTNFPKIAAWLEEFSEKQNAILSRAAIVSLRPLGKVYSHRDLGLYYAPRDRYHLVLKSAGNLMINGGQREIFNEGEVWWYNNKVRHKAINNSNEERIHLIFDLLPKSKLKILKNLLLWFYWNLRPFRFFKYK